MGTGPGGRPPANRPMKANTQTRTEVTSAGSAACRADRLKAWRSAGPEAKQRKKITHQNGAQHTNITDSQSSPLAPLGSRPIPLAAAVNSNGTSVKAPKYHRADRPAGHSRVRMARRVPGLAAQ